MKKWEHGGWTSRSLSAYHYDLAFSPLSGLQLRAELATEGSAAEVARHFRGIGVGGGAQDRWVNNDH